MNNTKKIYEDVIIGYNEKNVEHKDNNGNLLYTENIKEPIIEKRTQIVPMTEQEIKDNEIYELKHWFDNVYRCQVEQAMRAQYFQQSYSYVDSYRNKTYTSLADLYNEGNVVQLKIRELTTK